MEEYDNPFKYMNNSFAFDQTNPKNFRKMRKWLQKYQQLIPQGTVSEIDKEIVSTYLSDGEIDSIISELEKQRDTGFISLSNRNNQLIPRPINAFKPLDTVELRNEMKKWINNISTKYHISTWDVSDITDFSYVCEQFNPPEFIINQYDDKLFFNENMINEYHTDKYPIYFSKKYLSEKLGQDNNNPLQQYFPSFTNNSMLIRNTHKTFYHNICNWDTSKATSFKGFLKNSNTFNQYLNYSTVNVVNMSEMFSGCLTFNQPINFYTGNVVDMSMMFKNCIEFDHDYEKLYEPNHSSSITNWLPVPIIADNNNFIMTHIENRVDIVKNCFNRNEIEGNNFSYPLKTCDDNKLYSEGTCTTDIIIKPGEHGLIRLDNIDCFISDFEGVDIKRNFDPNIDKTFNINNLPKSINIFDIFMKGNTDNNGVCSDNTQTDTQSNYTGIKNNAKVPDGDEIFELITKLVLIPIIDLEEYSELWGSTIEELGIKTDPENIWDIKFDKQVLDGRFKENLTKIQNLLDNEKLYSYNIKLSKSDTDNNLVLPRKVLDEQDDLTQETCDDIDPSTIDDTIMVTLPNGSIREHRSEEVRQLRIDREIAKCEQERIQGDEKSNSHIFRFLQQVGRRGYPYFNINCEKNVGCPVEVLHPKFAYYFQNTTEHDIVINRSQTNIGFNWLDLPNKDKKQQIHRINLKSSGTDKVNADFSFSYRGISYPSLFITDNVTNMEQMFFNCKKFNRDIKHFNYNNVSNFKQMFQGCEKLTEFRAYNRDGTIISDLISRLNFHGTDRTPVTNLENMFNGCKYLKFDNPNIKNWDISHTNSLRGLFQDTEFNEDISLWDVRHITDFTDIFKDCDNLYKTGNFDDIDRKNIHAIFKIESSWKYQNSYDFIKFSNIYNSPTNIINPFLKHELFGYLPRYNYNDIRKKPDGKVQEVLREKVVQLMFNNCQLEFQTLLESIKHMNGICHREKNIDLITQGNYDLQNFCIDDVVDKDGIHIQSLHPGPEANDDNFKNYFCEPNHQTITENADSCKEFIEQTLNFNKNFSKIENNLTQVRINDTTTQNRVPTCNSSVPHVQDKFLYDRAGNEYIYNGDGLNYIIRDQPRLLCSSVTEISTIRTQQIDSKQTYNILFLFPLVLAIIILIFFRQKIFKL